MNSDECKREKKHSKSEYVKYSLGGYLQKRNYNNFQPTKITKNQLLLYSSVEYEISNPNSIGYRCYNCDPVIIDNNFSKFLIWLKESIDDKCSLEIEQLIGPVFCHLYLDILQGGHPEKANAFFLAHASCVEKINKVPFILDLIQSLSGDSTYLRQEFRSNKYVVHLSIESKKKLMNFIEEQCHVIFLQVFRTWFEFKIDTDQVMETECDLVPNECCLSAKLQKIITASSDLDNSTKLVFSIDVSNVILEISCGFLSRYHGIFAYNQNNSVHIRSLHSFDNLSKDNDSMLVKLNGHSTKVNAISISRNYLASASSDGKICIYRKEEFEHVGTCSGHLKSVYCLKISSNELYLASGSEDNTIRLWNIANGNFLRIFAGHEQAIVCLDFYPNCLYLVSGSTDKNIRIWNIETGYPLRLLCGSQGAIRDVSSNPLGQYLVSASDDRYLRTWDILTGRVIAEVKCKNGFPNKLQWSKDGQLLCCAFSDNTLKIWKNFDNLEFVQTVICSGTILNIEYCFGSFGVITTKCIPQ